MKSIYHFLISFHSALQPSLRSISTSALLFRIFSLFFLLSLVPYLLVITSHQRRLASRKNPKQTDDDDDDGGIPFRTRFSKRQQTLIPNPISRHPRSDLCFCVRSFRIFCLYFRLVANHFQFLALGVMTTDWAALLLTVTRARFFPRIQFPLAFECRSIRFWNKEKKKDNGVSLLFELMLISFQLLYRSEDVNRINRVDSTTLVRITEIETNEIIEADRTILATKEKWSKQQLSAATSWLLKSTWMFVHACSQQSVP